jgi:hypothetical protein
MVFEFYILSTCHKIVLFYFLTCILLYVFIMYNTMFWYTLWNDWHSQTNGLPSPCIATLCMYMCAVKMFKIYS